MKTSLLADHCGHHLPPEDPFVVLPLDPQVPLSRFLFASYGLRPFKKDLVVLSYAGVLEPVEIEHGCQEERVLLIFDQLSFVVYRSQQSDRKGMRVDGRFPTASRGGTRK